MAKSVTLKDTDGTTIYPVTDIALVNNGIHADPIASTTDAAYVNTEMIQDGAVTSDKIDWTTFETGWVELSQTYGVKYKRVGKTVTLAMLNPGNITMTGYVERLLVAATDGAIIAPSIELRFPVYGRNNTAIYGLITPAGKISLFNWGAEQVFEPGGLTFTVSYNIDQTKATPVWSGLTEKCILLPKAKLIFKPDPLIAVGRAFFTAHIGEIL